LETAVLTLTRTATVDSPDNYILGEHDPVPGSLYTMLVTVSNEGTGVARNVIIVDKVPAANMVAYKVNVQETEDNVNVTSGLGGNTTGISWNVFYTTNPSPDMDYDGAGWTQLPPGEPESDDEYAIPSTATFIKWQSNPDVGVPSGTYNTFQWSCYIK
jgi:hypothetical protein